MATWNKTESWKSFYQKKKQELKTKYPFLKEYQIREKAKKSWTQNKMKIFKDKFGLCNNDETIEEATKQVIDVQKSSDNEEEESCNKQKPTTTDKPMLRRCVARRTRGRKCGYTCMKETSHSCVDIIATSTQPHVYVCSSAIDKYIEVEETDTVEGLAVDLCDSSTMNVAALDNDIVGIVDSNESDFKCNNGHPHNDNGCHGDDHHSDDDDNCQAVRPLKAGESVLEMFRPTTETIERVNITATGKSPISKRRMFVSSAEESNSNFHTLFTDDCDIFM